ncbi:hypothetical protein CYLTODRAFT_99312 [Cylindrobasidium torrendii FP15055 ss-10]|uniref:BAH domain-containing protein n=1 Tax=Cylindrobasidium torrendii FP15055 ss-10 TaxID=1314674 RepID=A0A0D7B225_9AGAR|nr:hypothetical protein CYLTODRAFT_99312 [Cylindrobasidium torrendii FP15055 ss-10]
MPQYPSEQDSDYETGSSTDEDPEEDDSPSIREFETWPERGRIVAHSKENDVENTLTLTRDDHVLIVPQEKHPEQATDFWVAKVRAIRSPPKENRNLWLKVQWYYHPIDVAQHVSKATSLSLGYSSHKNEFIFSDHFDIISFHSVERTIPVYRYVETSFAPPNIPADGLWSRYDYELKTRTLMPNPPSADCDTLKCGAYQPDTEMRMCPRERCMRWWHVRCLGDTVDASEDDNVVQ